MFRAGQQGWSKIEDLIASLDVLREDAPECLAWLVPEVAAILGGDKVLAFGVRQDQGQLSLAFAHSHGTGLSRALAPRFDELLRSKQSGMLFDPSRPEAAQRNVAIALPPVLEIPPGGLIARRGSRRRPVQLIPGEGLMDPDCRRSWVSLYREAGIDKQYLLRMLICDGATLLAWLGVFLPEQASEHARQVLSSLAGPLQKRLKLETLVGKSSASAAVLETVLERLAAPSFLLLAEGKIEHANSSGRAMMNANPFGLRESLLKCLTPNGNGTDRAFDVTRLSSAGVPDHYLAVQRRGPEHDASKVEEAVKRWGLRPPGARVLSKLIHGHANKTIAEKLGCTESTIELHVTHILRQAAVDSRAALIAKFWTTL